VNIYVCFMFMYVCIMFMCEYVCIMFMCEYVSMYVCVSVCVRLLCCYLIIVTDDNHALGRSTSLFALVLLWALFPLLVVSSIKVRCRSSSYYVGRQQMNDLLPLPHAAGTCPGGSVCFKT
jgi:hypothetical protein